MTTRFTVECDDDQARAIAVLSRRYGISEAAVLEQLIEVGLEHVEEPPA